MERQSSTPPQLQSSKCPGRYTAPISVGVPCVFHTLVLSHVGIDSRSVWYHVYIEHVGRLSVLEQRHNARASVHTCIHKHARARVPVQTFTSRP